jgi:hypothetical protein
MSAIGPEPAGVQDDDRELGLCRAKKDGREVVSLRSFERGGEYMVECEVYPVTGLVVDPLRPGPYRFSDEREARLFMTEAAQALTYLGCEVT